MNAIKTQLGDQGVFTVTFDQQDRPVNTITRECLDELNAIMTRIESGDIAAKGLVFTSAKPDVFLNGADLFEFGKLNADEMHLFLVDGQRLFERIHRLGIPTIAAINGHCLGGGVELALACDATVVADRGDIRIGLPETKLGILPGWGGTTRLTHRLGARKALRLLLPGKTVAPRLAQKLGLIDEVVRPEALLAAARRLLKHSSQDHSLPLIDRAIHKFGLLRRVVLWLARRQAEAVSRGHYPAINEVLNVVDVACGGTLEDGLAAERAAVERLMETEASRHLLRLFYLRQDAKRSIKQTYAGLTSPVHHAAVVGGGTMGAGVVHALVSSGIPVRLVERNADAAAAALGRVHGMLLSDQRAKRFSPLQVDQAMRRVSPCTDWSGLRLADIVIEAVPEDPEIKCETFTRLDRLTRPDVVLASNTSSLSIADLSKFVADPSRVIGLHFFNPVPRMPLVEVVRTAVSDRHAIAVGASLAMRLGKVPIVVSNGPGFLINRLLIPYLAEAMLLAGEGVWVPQIDRAMKRWGMPMGPFELLDQVGMPVAAGIFRSVGSRIAGMDEPPMALRLAVDEGWHGRHVGRGFYRYPASRWDRLRGRSTLNHALVRSLHLRGRPTDQPHRHLQDKAIQWRLIARMINEAAAALHEKVVDDTDTIDLATVMGLGLAPFRGGLMRFAQSEGVARVTQVLEELASSHGSRFSPHPYLRTALSTELQTVPTPSASLSSTEPTTHTVDRLGLRRMKTNPSPSQKGLHHGPTQ